MITFRTQGKATHHNHLRWLISSFLPRNQSIQNYVRNMGISTCTCMMHQDFDYEQEWYRLVCTVIYSYDTCSSYMMMKSLLEKSTRSRSK